VISYQKLATEEITTRCSETIWLILPNNIIQLQHYNVNKRSQVFLETHYTNTSPSAKHLLLVLALPNSIRDYLNIKHKHVLMCTHKVPQKQAN